jgi:hypothetical protein
MNECHVPSPTFEVEPRLSDRCASRTEGTEGQPVTEIVIRAAEQRMHSNAAAAMFLNPFPRRRRAWALEGRSELWHLGGTPGKRLPGEQVPAAQNAAVLTRRL